MESDSGPQSNSISPPMVEPRGRAARVLASLLRFFGLWVGISGTYAVMCGTCPFCGRPGCPVGIGVAGIFGALGSLTMTQGRRLLAVIRRQRISKPH